MEKLFVTKINVSDTQLNFTMFVEREDKTIYPTQLLTFKASPDRILAADAIYSDVDRIYVNSLEAFISDLTNLRDIPVYNI